MSLAEVRAALAAELSATPAYYDFKVLRREREGALWRITLEPGYVYADGQWPGQASAQTLLDDRLDGAAAWWGAPVKGSAQVLSVVPEDDQLWLQAATVEPPGPDHLIRLYPPRFLQAVDEAWQDDAWAGQAMQALHDLGAPRPLPDPLALDGSPFRWLRARQRASLGLLRHGSAYLWGPPGTGKTTTLGVLLAEWLERRPQGRVLLLSTTHQAVDLATLAVDKALQKGRREALRPSVQRLGTRFDAAAFVGREHLIPAADDALIARLAQAEAARPAARDAAALQAWAERVGRLREALRRASLQVLQRCRLAAMTATRATCTLKTLRELAPDADTPPFDLVVFDEASQVPLAQALVLAPLGRRRLYAGDPQQLAPVLRSREAGARRWLGGSAFSRLPRGDGGGLPAPSVVMPDEQSRMAEPIGQLVSDLYYGGTLRVAEDARSSPDWAAARRRAFGPVPAEVHVHVEPVAQDGAWSAAARGPVRAASAEAIATWVAQALQQQGWAPDEMIVLTPFRAQRALLRERLRAHGVPESVRVSTVHRAQGSEAPVVLFDPADGAQPFLQTEDAQRLFNVAYSRAQAKLLVFLSAGDRRNPWLAAVPQRLRLAADARPAQPLAALAGAADFPANAVGQRVQAGRQVGEVSRASADGSRLWLVNERSGLEQELDAAFWRARARQA